MLPMRLLVVLCVSLPLILARQSLGEEPARKNIERFPFDLPKGAGPWVRPTQGEVWPKPQQQVTSSKFMVIRPSTFQFQTVGKTCDILEAALKRYYGIILGAQTVDMRKSIKNVKAWKSAEEFRGYLDVLQVNLLGNCESWPVLDMDEHYEIKIDSEDRPLEGLLVSQSIWGILRGLESFSQLVYASPAGIAYQVNSTLLTDWPRFSHRGLLLDSSRHFLSMDVLKESLDLMAQNKYNVLHWHIVDDSSFPYESARFPAMSTMGAYNRYTHVYTREDIREVIEYARIRGIRVMAEFDTPGHTQSWGLGVPGLLTSCYGKDGNTDGTFGPIDPLSNSTYTFLRQFFTEVVDTFPERYVHLGGDEVDFTCWASNPVLQEFMAEQGLGEDYSRLEQLYMQKLLDIMGTLNTSYVVWQEVIDNNVTLKSDTVVHVWKGTFETELERVTRLGYRTLLSSPWYLNYINYGLDWMDFYEVEPLNFNGTETQKALVIGGEACMWGEYVDSVNLIPRTWPRACVVAERLWSDATVNNSTAASPRLEEQRCRLLRRGYRVEPITGVGYCEYE